jgi:uncharacterized phage protein (TIGR02218 family)
MKIVPPTLAAKFEQGVTTLAQAWRLTRKDGLVVALTQHDRDLLFDSTVFQAAAPFLPRDLDGELSLAPDRTALSGALETEVITEIDLTLGRWTGAKVDAFLVDWTNTSDALALWQGYIGSVTWQGQAFEFDIEGPEAALAGEIGRVYARTCDARLGDGRCKVDMTQAGRRLSAAVTSVPTDRDVLIASPAGMAVDAFINGRVAFTSGVTMGWSSDIASITVQSGQWRIELARAFAVKPAIGDSVSLEMGCDKTFVTCKDRFANALNFRGQPNMPGDDVAFGGPDARGNHGGKR